MGNGLDGDIFWLVAAHGTQADYVRNLQANPGYGSRPTAHGAPGQRSRSPAMTPWRFRTLPYQWDAAIGRMMASAPLTIRIDLDSAP